MSVSSEGYKFYSRKKSKELDLLKEIQKLIAEFNENPTFHYLLKLKFGVRRGWF